MTRLMIFLSCLLPCLALSSEESEKAELLELTNYINQVSGQPTEKIDFKKITSNLSNLRQPYRFSIPERYLVYEKYQESIMVIPNYAEILSSQLTKLYDDRLALPSDSPDYEYSTSLLETRTSVIFMALQALPTKEMVLALADLYEYTKFDPRPVDELGLTAEPIPRLAGKILNQMSIKNRPAPKVDLILSQGQDILDMVEKWRVWCKDVKAGKIEPEFGPEVFPDGSSIPPIAERHQTRPPKPMPTKSQPTVTTSVQTESSPWLWVTGSLAILTGYAVWRMKKVEK